MKPSSYTYCLRNTQPESHEPHGPCYVWNNNSFDRRRVWARLVRHSCRFRGSDSRTRDADKETNLAPIVRVRLEYLPPPRELASEQEGLEGADSDNEDAGQEKDGCCARGFTRHFLHFCTASRLRFFKASTVLWRFTLKRTGAAGLPSKPGV